MEKVITIESAIEKSRQYFNNDELAATVFPTKYALTDKDGNLHEETPDDMHHRMRIPRQCVVIAAVVVVIVVVVLVGGVVVVCM